MTRPCCSFVGTYACSCRAQQAAGSSFIAWIVKETLVRCGGGAAAAAFFLTALPFVPCHQIACSQPWSIHGHGPPLLLGDGWHCSCVSFPLNLSCTAYTAPLHNSLRRVSCTANGCSCSGRAARQVKWDSKGGPERPEALLTSAVQPPLSLK